MTFEFEYDNEAEQMTIIYDSSIVLKVFFDEGKPVYKNFNKIQDEEVENLLKKFCKDVYALAI
jgi:predicted phosphoribosyltransferase